MEKTNSKSKKSRENQIQQTSTTFKRYRVFALTNPLSGDGLAASFLTDYPHQNVNDVFVEEFNQTINCDMRFYNVREKQENVKCMNDLESTLNENDITTRKVIALFGGDGSLGTSLKFLRTSKIVDEALSQGKIYFVTLPYGTGNDGPQTFGWGTNPLSETWASDLTSIMKDIITSQTIDLSLWTVECDGEVRDAHERLAENKFILCYYLNIGLDARIGYNLERLRTGKRCLNQTLYFFLGVWDFFARCCKRGHEPVDNQIKSFVSHKQKPNGYVAQKVMADMANLERRPLNIIATNLTQSYGGFMNDHSWDKSKERLADPQRTIRKQGITFATSCDESDSKLEQKIDDDKMELMCQEMYTDYLNFDMTRLGQVRSPYSIELQEHFKTQTDQSLLFGVDGEFHSVKNATKINVYIDKSVPRLKILRRVTQPTLLKTQSERIIGDLRNFNTTLI